MFIFQYRQLYQDFHEFIVKADNISLIRTIPFFSEYCIKYYILIFSSKINAFCRGCHIYLKDYISLMHDNK